MRVLERLFCNYMWLAWVGLLAGATHEISCWFGTGFVGYPARSLSM